MRPKVMEPVIKMDGDITYLAEFYPAPNFLMYYIYALKNIGTQELYYGFTRELQRRLKEHNNESTWKSIYYEAYLAESDARQREKKLKQYGHARTRLKNRIKESLNTEN